MRREIRCNQLITVWMRCVIKLSCFFLLISQVQLKCCHKNKCLSLKEVSHLKHIHLVFTGQFQFSSNVIYILHYQDYWHPITKQYEPQSVFGISATYLLRACRKHWESYFWEKNSSYRNCVKTPFFHDVASYYASLRWYTIISITD